MKNKGFFVVHEWMIAELGLKGVELLVYAIVYGFTQIEDQRFFGTRKYLAEMTGYSVRAVQDALNNMVENGLLLKELTTFPNGGFQFAAYRANLHPQCRNFTGEETAHNDIIHKSISNTVSNSSNTRRFKKPTVDEVREYCLKHNYTIDPEAFIDYNESKGWLVGKSPMKDWKAAVRTWVRNEKKRNGTQSKKPAKIDWGDGE